MQLLCEDGSDTYVLPFSCEWRDGRWITPKNGNPLGVKVVGWRPESMGWKGRSGRRAKGRMP